MFVVSPKSNHNLSQAGFQLLKETLTGYMQVNRASILASNPANRSPTFSAVLMIPGSSFDHQFRVSLNPEL